MLVVDYTETLVPGIGLSVRYKKERSWTGSVATTCNAVKANNPDIIQAYAEYGIPNYDDIVEDQKENQKPRTEADDEVEAEAIRRLEDTDGGESVSEEEMQKVFDEDKPEIPENWRDSLGWVEMRKLACSLTDEPVRNKKDAIAVIEANE